jgi:predicted TIM-barrel fold metal-dependent hydrolase
LRFPSRRPEPRGAATYLEHHWRESVIQRGIHELNSIAYPVNAPLTSRPDWRPGRAGAEVGLATRQGLDPFGTSVAICNCLYGVRVLFSEDMAAGFARAVNDWIAREWLDKEPRLRASIVVPVESRAGGRRD